MKHVLLHSRKGFTLLELLMVVLLIGILTGIAVPQYTRALDRAKSADGITQGKVIYDSAVRFQAETGNKPDKFDLLDVELEYDGSLDTNTITMGDFTYTLGTNISAKYKQGQEGEYYLQFNYPTEDENGVYAAMLCCPGTNEVCKVMGNTEVNNCIEMK
jgi:prepilin-type N-terminal cleavage/methylation domain-containing protein